MNLTYKAEKEICINEILNNIFNISTRLKNKLIKNKLIFVNSKFIDTRSIIKTGDIITIDLSLPEDNSNIVPKQMHLDIIYEDEHLLAINKPAGLPVHPSILHFQDSLANGVKYYFDTINLKKKIRAINRIDLNTSGLVLFAKNEYVQEALIKQMNTNVFKKTYLAVVFGILQEKSGTINVPIARKESSIIERCISPNGQSAVTHYEILEEFNNYSLIQCILETGRTHQIRVHMAHIGHPLLGDNLYNPKDDLNLINRQALHSYKMEFVHPISNKKITLIAKLPNDIELLKNGFQNF